MKTERYLGCYPAFCKDGQVATYSMGDYTMDNETSERKRSVIHWIGIDVAKSKFDAALVRKGQKWATTALCEVPVTSFERSRKGVASLRQWINRMLEDAVEKVQVRVIMEATGKYSTELAIWLIEQEPSIAPAIVNPHHTSAFIKSLGLRNKTDKLEARALGFYGVEREPCPYEPPAPEIVELRALCRYRDALVREKVADENRAEGESESRFVTRMRSNRLVQLGRDIKRIEDEMTKVVNTNAQVKHDLELLCSIYGVGFITAVVVIAELGDLRRFRKARQLTAFAGLSPRIYQSGTSVSGRPRMCKKGNPRVRQALYLSAMSAIRGQNDLQRMYKRMTSEGKSPMAALGAVMRKQLTVMRAILISEELYNPDWRLCGKLQIA